MDVNQYLSLSLNDRQKHLDLEEECLERGGGSAIHRGVLAQYLGGNIYSKPADLCHACHNGKCSNPKHLYWGTRSENVKDSIENGTWKNPYYLKVEELGEEEAKKFFSIKAKEWHEKRKTPQHKGTIYINDGKTNKRISKEENIPEGWVRGRKEYRK